MSFNNYKIIITADETPVGQYTKHFNALIIDEVAIVVVGENLENQDIVLHCWNNQL